MLPAASAVIVSVLVAGFVMIPVAARGQAPDPAADAVFQVGPLAFTPAISIPELGLDSNVFNDNENPQKSFTANVQPEIDAWLRFGPLRLGGRQQFNFIYFAEFASESAVNTRSGLTAELLLLWARPYAGVSYVKTNDRPDPTIDTRAVSRSRPASAGIDFRLSSSTSIDIGADYDTISFDDEASFEGASLQTALDRDTRNYRATLKYAVTPPTTLTLTAAQRDERFPYSPEQNSESFRVVPGITLAADAVISGTVEVGWLSFTPRGGTFGSFNGVVSSVDLGYVFLGLTRFQLTADRDVTPSIDRVSTYALMTNVRGTITHRVSERWDVTASAAHTRLDFARLRDVLPDADGEPLVDRADTVYTYSGGIGFYFNQGLRLGVRVESIRRESPRPIDRYDNLRILGSISYTRR